MAAKLPVGGPFTVFAPTNSAFCKLPAGTVETLLKDENKTRLQQVFTYHVLVGKYNAKDIMKAIKKGMGKPEYTTVIGARLMAIMDGDCVKLKDVSWNISTGTIAG